MRDQLDLLIVNPMAAHGIKGGHAVYGDLGRNLIACEPPLWCRLIAGYVRDRGFSVKIIDAEAENWEPIDVSVEAIELSPRLICIAAFGHQPSASTQQMVGASETAKWIKEGNSNQKVIMVGGHVAALPERTLREEAIDYACNGEGPATIVGLLEGLKSEIWDKNAIPGLIWWAAPADVPVTAIHNNPPAPLIPVADLHGNAWDLLPMAAYRAHNWQCFGDLGARQPYASIYTSLGCPYRCTFCCIQSPFSPELNGNRYRMRDPWEVVAEIAHLWDKYGVKTIKIVDEMFILNTRHYTEIAEGVVKGMEAGTIPKDLNLWGYSRIDTVKEGHLPLLRSAGFRWLALGIESGSAHVRDGSQKALKNDDIVGVVRSIQAANINVIGNFIFGLPDDNATSMQDTLDLAQELNCEFANFYSAMAYPGSRLYAEALKSGATLPATWSGYSQHNSDCRPLDTLHVSAREVLAFRDAAFQTYFSSPKYQEMVKAKFGQATLDHVRSMLQYKLPRKLLTGEIA
jgi:anaerobic magnesium-protoporphyrin IX monomethyl ester cyclase